MPADANPGNGASTASPRPRTEDSERRLREREQRWERPEHYALRMALGHDDLERGTPDVSNLARIQPYLVGPEHDPIRAHRTQTKPSPRVTTDEDDS